MSAAAEPRILLIGGIDPSGGAGLTVDSAVIAMRGGQPLPIPVVLTAQNRHGFRRAFALDDVQWRAALDAALDDGSVQAIKIGLLGDAETIEGVGRAIRSLAATVPIVVDPVLSATVGGLDVGSRAIAAYREHLVPLATLVTPNLPECSALFENEAATALQLGARAVLLKGGHGSGETAEDVLFTASGEQRFVRPRLDVGKVRGTGCALSSAIAFNLASGSDTAQACREAGDWLASRLVQLGSPAVDGLPRSLPLKIELE
jgi:hydroxymethylpyrimidine/phosphomethylpyrimidine kinase